MQVFIANMWLCPQLDQMGRHPMNAISLSGNTLSWIEKIQGNESRLCFIHNFDRVFNRFAWEIDVNECLHDYKYDEKQYQKMSELCKYLESQCIKENIEYINQYPEFNHLSSHEQLKRLEQLNKPTLSSIYPPPYHSIRLPIDDVFSVRQIEYDENQSEFTLYMSDWGIVQVPKSFDFLSYHVKFKVHSYIEKNNPNGYFLLNWRDLPHYPSLCQKLVKLLELPENSPIRKNLWHLDQIIIKVD